MMWAKEYTWDDPDNLHEIKKLYMGDSGAIYAEVGDHLYRVSISVITPEGYTSGKINLKPVSEVGD